MRFTRLRLNGFKSFVDPTDLLIADGLTGVVGPNGCGKSNLLEALRWVMGENRPTAMRGGGMEDVIFAGAASRPARNFAEVSLHIDNADRLAPSGFNDADAIEIVRRITRDAGSAYKANTKDVRARDVQMLFADASTGAHSPALVRQGQISELINAKPKARRRILEEAAGISGLYQRRHEAELKLNGAETNLTRVDDVIEQLASQLSQLARQARQAARYREIGKDLRRTEGLLLYMLWREADLARHAADEALRNDLTRTAEAERAARAAAGDREAAEEALPPLREEHAIAAAVVQRLTVQRDTLSKDSERALRAIEAMEGRMAQLVRDIDREGALNTDAEGTLAGLRAEAAELSSEAEGQDEALHSAEAAAHEAAQVLEERESDLSRVTEDVARLAARHHSAQRLLEDAEKTLERCRREETEAQSMAEASARDLELADSTVAGAEAKASEAATQAEAAEAALVAADEARGAVHAKEAEARAQASEADGEVSALRAEASALARLVQRDTAEGDQILDILKVVPGYEMALGAALADDLRAPVLKDGQGSGWASLGQYPDPQSLPPGTLPLSDFVKEDTVLTRRLSQVGVVDRAEGARLQAALLTGQRLVSTEGDLWRWDGFRSVAEDAPSATALKLQQLNRLEDLKQELEKATARATGAQAAHAHLKTELAALTEADRTARETRRTADQRLAETGRALSKAEADRNILLGKRETATLAVTRLTEEAHLAAARLSEAQAAQADLGDLDALRSDADDLKLTVEAARMTMVARRSAQDEQRREIEARAKRLAAIATEETTWAERLANAGTRLSEIEDRRAATERDLAKARGAPDRIAAEQDALKGQIEGADTRLKAASDRLAEGETRARDAVESERAAEKAAGEVREARAASEARAQSAREVVQGAAERIREEQDCAPDALLEQLETDPEKMPSAESLDADAARLRRQRDALGAVNLRAEEDAKEVQTEHDVLVSEKTDLEEAIRALRSGIASLNKEGRERLLTAFEQVNSNFSMLFTHLFGGGEAKLMLVESDDPLEAGLEIMCQPPGKKLSTLSLLSGGEQTLTALALIFAVFLANPAPICVLDEVDAPLDDANVTRFCDLLDEMTRRTDTRFLIITHHAVTMSRMDRLFGVTMGEQGVSQLVSVDLRKAEAMVA